MKRKYAVIFEQPETNWAAYVPESAEWRPRRTVRETISISAAYASRGPWTADEARAILKRPIDESKLERLLKK